MMFFVSEWTVKKSHRWMTFYVAFVSNLELHNEIFGHWNWSQSSIMLMYKQTAACPKLNYEWYIGEELYKRA
jgi:hypothetical protein